MPHTLSGTPQTLPPLPFLAHDILIATTTEDADIGSIAEKIAREPGIAARIIGITNSVFYQGSRPIHSVEGAIVRLGLKRVRMLTLSTLLAESFDTKKCRAFKADQYWYQAIGTAHCAVLTAQTQPGVDHEMAYLGGLLHNIGLLLLVNTYPLKMSTILSAHQAKPGHSLAAMTREQLGTDHREAGLMLLSNWGLPDEICAATAADAALDEQPMKAPFAALIGFCARWTANGYSLPPPDNPLQLEPKQLQDIANDCRQQQRQQMAFAQLLNRS